MLESMTGYGSARLENEELSVVVEIKSLNANKNTDVSLRVSQHFLTKEIEIKQLLVKELVRGKINISIKYASKAEGVNQVRINEPLVKNYIYTLKKIANATNVPEQDILKMAMSMPDAYLAETNDEKLEEHWEQVVKAIYIAIEECRLFRQREGQKLRQKLESYIERILQLLQQVAERDPERSAFVREKIKKQLQEYIKTEHFDPNRFEQELIYYNEKLDITEEKVRLKTHLNHFLELLSAKQSHGKKLIFLTQEIGREINTMGAKANDAILQKLVVEMKNELDKIKEQVLNIT